MPRVVARPVPVRPRPRLIGVAAALGGPDPDVALGPLVVADDREVTWLRPRQVEAVGRYAALATLAGELASEVEASLRHGRRAVVLGGDHAIAIGTWKGVARAYGPRSVGLVWIDAHLDAHTPATSPSGNVHGMPLAVLLGHGDLRLVSVPRSGEVLDPERVVVVGARSFEPEEARLLDSLGVRVITMQEIRSRGPTPVLAEAFAIARGPDGRFGLSIDLDAVDPRIAPGVSTPAEDGLSASFVVAAAEHAAADARCLAIEVAELDPSRDRHGRTAALARTLIDVATERGGNR